MVSTTSDPMETAFTVSVDLRGKGVSTGISAIDRAKTIMALVDKKTKVTDFTKPGHVFPLIAKDGGVLRRTGHTEAAIDFARLAGFEPAGVIAEIMNENGSMARLPELFEVAKKLYGLDFKLLDNVQTYHEDVNVYEVISDKNEHVGILYEDLFPRETKRSGAWMNELRSQGMHNGKIERPHVTFTCNLTKPTESKPSLLTYREVETIFHEFGHCLHGLLSNSDYSSISGTSVFWDFVELPSQIMENWCYQPEALNLYARHYKTGEVIPTSMIEKIKA